MNLANIKIYKPNRAPKLVMTVQTRHLESILFFFSPYLWIMSRITTLTV